MAYVYVHVHALYILNEAVLAEQVYISYWRPMTSWGTVATEKMRYQIPLVNSTRLRDYIARYKRTIKSYIASNSHICLVELF